MKLVAVSGRAKTQLTCYRLRQSSMTNNAAGQQQSANSAVEHPGLKYMISLTPQHMSVRDS